jgi:hypothetical protein
VLSMSALKLCNPVVFSVGMVADNLSLHANMIARADISGARPLWLQRLQPEADVTIEARILIAAHSSRATSRSSGVNPFERDGLRLDGLVMR